MELSLLREAQARAAIEGAERRARQLRHALQSCALRGLDLLIERLELVALGKEQVAIHPREVAVDVFLARDLLDALDRRGMAFRRQPGAFRAVQPLQLEVAVVQHVAEMRRGHLRHPAAKRPVVEQRYAAARLRQQVGRRKSGDAAAHDAHLHMDVFGERRARWHFGGRLPYGFMEAHALPNAMHVPKASLQLAQRLKDFIGTRVTPLAVLREHELAVGRDVEDAATSLHELGLDAQSLPDLGRQTDGAWQVVSGHAVGDGDFHAERTMESRFSRASSRPASREASAMMRSMVACTCASTAAGLV